MQVFDNDEKIVVNLDWEEMKKLFPMNVYNSIRNSTGEIKMQVFDNDEKIVVNLDWEEMKKLFPMNVYSSIKDGTRLVEKTFGNIVVSVISEYASEQMEFTPGKTPSDAKSISMAIKEDSFTIEYSLV